MTGDSDSVQQAPLALRNQDGPRSLARRPPDTGITSGKRALDLALALMLVAILAVPFLVLVLLLLLVEGRPLFHIGERMMTPERSFRLVKLRSMRPAAGADGVTGGDKDGRMSRLQRLLRASRMDEIPQLWNVIRGEMSLVGPRPPLRAIVRAYPALYAQVLRSRPGITGLASLRFHAHEERILGRCATAGEADSAYRRRCIARKARIDLIYQRNRTVWLDLRLIAETALFPLRRAAPMLWRGLRRRLRRGGRFSRRSRPGSATASATGFRPSRPARIRPASPEPGRHANNPPATRRCRPVGAGRSHGGGSGPRPG